MKELYFATGVLVGGVISWYFTKKHYEKILKEEAKSFRETLKKLRREKEHEEVEEPEEVEAPKEEKTKESEFVREARDYSNRINECGYSEEEFDKKGVAPYVIPPTEFDMIDDYDVIELTYFSDGVLVDDDGQVITNIDAVVGEESLKHFGEYEDDCVHVRNDRLKCDYEIIKDLETYADYLERNPHKA